MTKIINPIAYCGKRSTATKNIAKQSTSTNGTNSSPSRLPVTKLRKHLSEQTSVSMRGLTRSHLCKVLDIQRRLDEQYPPLAYNGRNSCYLDSAMVALFHRKSKYLSRHIVNAINVSPEIITAHNDIKRVIDKVQRIFLNKKVEAPMTCENIRKHFAGPYFQDISEQLGVEWLSSQDDPVHVLKVLEFMYDIPKSVIYNETSRTVKRPRSIKGEIDSWMIYPDQIADRKKFSELFPSRTDDDTGSKTWLKSAKVMYVTLIRVRHVMKRGQVVEEKLYDPLVPDEYIQISDKHRRLELVSILIHSGDAHGGHYTALLKLKEGLWVYYDDMAHKVQFAGSSLAQALRFDSGFAKKNSTGLVYI